MHLIQTSSNCHFEFNFIKAPSDWCEKRSMLLRFRKQLYLFYVLKRSNPLRFSHQFERAFTSEVKNLSS